MTPEEKQLLFKDLCARLPYGVYGQFDVPSEKSKFERVLVVGDMCGIFSGDCLFKPYLRLMSSMTERERDEFIKFRWTTHDGEPRMYEWCDYANAHHFDYRGLISMGLALEAPVDMYKNE